jgi:bla regulator protein blaR1
LLLLHADRALLDPLTNFVIALVRTVCWFQPLVDLAARCLHLDQEIACDAAVTAGTPTRELRANLELGKRLSCT